MIYGVVNLRREATLPLVIGEGLSPPSKGGACTPRNSNGQRQLIDTVIDTGFSGFLSLPSAIITQLALPWSASDIATLGDGSETLFDLYTATVIWDGQYREIYIAESETEPLLGMGLLYGYRLQVDNIEGGSVKIEALRS
jgi:clan AA aspartic protease